MFAPVYLDHNATTPADPAVVEAMLPYLSALCGNASSRHEYGRAARRAIDEARSKVAAAVGAHASEVVFTSGGSEANNLLIKGAAACLKPGVLVVGAIEHPCVIRPAEQLRKRGWTLHKLAVDGVGRFAAAEFAALMAERPKIVSLMLANNETGVLQDIAPLATQARAAGAWFHSDAVQALGKIPVDFRRLNAAGVNALSVSAHKIGGPKGAAALVLDKRLDIEPLIAGGGHERGLRSGTENVAAIVGFGVACELASERLAAQAVRQRRQPGVGAALGARVAARALQRALVELDADVDRVIERQRLRRRRRRPPAPDQHDAREQRGDGEQRGAPHFGSPVKAWQPLHIVAVGSWSLRSVWHRTQVARSCGGGWCDL